MKKKTLLLLVALTMFIAIGTHLLFKPIKESLPIVSSQNIKQTEAKLTSMDENHVLMISKLKANNDFLVNEIEHSKIQIQSANRHVKYLQLELKKHVATTKNFIYQDTSQFVASCDSLKNELIFYIDADNYKDSTVNNQIAQYENLIQTKDSAIESMETDYHCLQQTSDTLVQLNHDLSIDLKHYQKLCVRTKRKDKFIVGSALVLAGFATATRLRSIN